jgi:hypothetical protein
MSLLGRLAAATFAFTMLAACGNGSDGKGPVAYLGRVSAPGDTWSVDRTSLGDALGGDVHAVKNTGAGRVFRVEDEGGDGSKHYVVGWSHPIDASNAPAACEELASWFEKSAAALPGKTDSSADPAESHTSMVASCLKAARLKADGSTSDTFLTYPNTRKGDYKYGLFAEMLTVHGTRTVTAALGAFKEP